MSEQQFKTYEGAAHAMQAGVGMELEREMNKACEPKHLRTGINATKVEHAALAGLLIEKGIINEEEYFARLVTEMNLEVFRYKERLSKEFGAKIVLY